MRIVLHNPNNVKGARSNELSLAHENMDAVLMPGIQTRLKKHAKQAVQFSNDQHHVFEWAANQIKKEPISNKACG
jgi:hypothetical protein